MATPISLAYPPVVAVSPRLSIVTAVKMGPFAFGKEPPRFSACHSTVTVKYSSHSWLPMPPWAMNLKVVGSLMV